MCDDLTLFVRSFISKQNHEKHLRGFIGRIVKGRTENDFLSLTEDTADRTAFFMSCEDLVHLIGLDTLQMLVKVGFELKYIEEKVQRGYKFQLLLIPYSEELNSAKLPQQILFTPTLANWEGVFSAVSTLFPEVSEYILQHKQALQDIPLTRIEEQAGFKFFDVRSVGKAHDQYLTVQRLISWGKQTNPTLADARAFLYFNMGIRDLFTGTGYTKTWQGEQGVKEYLAANCLRSQLLHLEVIDLEPVTIDQINTLL